MKHLILLFALGFFLVQCQTEQKKEAPEIDLNSQKVKVDETGDPIVTTSCYQLVNNRDSILIELTFEGKVVKGWARYNFFEKDGAIGKLLGTIEKDTLRLTYEFASEGTMNKRELYYLRNNNKLFEGAGELEQVEGRPSEMTYKNPQDLIYNKNTYVLLDECPEGFIPQDVKAYFKKEQIKGTNQ